ncbi:MAG TPA: glycoside hydrolase family 30 beta sandwich domain-containing protein [Chitinophagaceae bacterium]|nr:glycoside hydrolase family 30 beta sandwich domain-containing protein [Chitinophagaceae bacterium]
MMGKIFLNTKSVISLIIASITTILLFACNKKVPGNSNGGTIITPPLPSVNEMDFWLTKSDQSALLKKQTGILSFGTTSNYYFNIEVDTTQTFQTIEGFGYCLTGGSAYVINRLPANEKNALLNELFGFNNNSISISYLRISIGASDLDASVFSYDDLPVGQTDVTLSNFSINPDKANLIPLLKEILLINPSLKIMATPWSPPVWMKDNNNSIGGSLQSQYYPVYAQYFVKYIQQMKAEGITIDAITPQNEPLNPNNNPSMLMTDAQQTDFIKNHLGPAFQSANITTKIIVYDHNCDNPTYPLNILNDAAARNFVSGSAFHLYAGDISVLSSVYAAYPNKGIYFTEQWTGANGNFGGDLKWHLKNVMIGSLRNWSKVVLEWNLASDPFYGPHTPGGCTECKGALTIGNSVLKNVSYYIIAHASKFVPPGSVRIGSNIVGDLFNVAFKTPSGKKVLIVENDGASDANFNIRFNNKWVTTNLPAGAAGTYTW